MATNALIIADFPPAAGGAHAVVADGALYTSIIGPVDRHGEVVGSDLRPQAEQAYANLGTVLQRAGATWADVVKLYTYVAPQAAMATGRAELEVVEARYLFGDGPTGVAVTLPLAEPSWLVALEAIAHPGVPKRSIAGVPDARRTGRWSAAVRVGPILYIGAQAVGGSEIARDQEPGAPSRIAAETRAVYESLGAILQQAGATWADVVKVHQYATRGDLAFDEIRRGREPFLCTGEFISTSVVASPRHPRWPSDGWLLQVDAEAYVGQKRFIRVPSVWANPGGLQATEAGGLCFMQAQMSRDRAGRTLYPDEPLAHAEQVFQNLDGVLHGMAVDWDHVVHARTFCRGPEDLAAVRRIRGRWLTPGQQALTDLLAGFFDPQARVEIELLAIARSAR